jgi:hypothetical protein
MENYNSGNIPIAKGDKFSLGKCPKIKLEK